MKRHVVIVGAGPGGLTSAMILAHRGFDVTVFEKASVVGGRNAPLYIDDYRFDTGPTFLMMSYILNEMFEETGRNVEDYLRFIRQDRISKQLAEVKELLKVAQQKGQEQKILKLMTRYQELLQLKERIKKTGSRRSGTCLK